MESLSRHGSHDFESGALGLYSQGRSVEQATDDLCGDRLLGRLLAYQLDFRVLKLFFVRCQSVRLLRVEGNRRKPERRLASLEAGISSTFSAQEEH